MIIYTVNTYIKPFGTDRYFCKTHFLPENMRLDEAHDYYWESCYAAWKDQLFEEFYVELEKKDTSVLEKRNP